MSISSAEFPCRVWWFFCTISNNITAISLLFIKMCSAVLAWVSSSWWVQWCYCIVHSFSADMWWWWGGTCPPINTLEFILQTSKDSFYGSGWNPSSGIIFLLFKIHFRYLNNCCCSLFKNVILTFVKKIFSVKVVLWVAIDGWECGHHIYACHYTSHNIALSTLLVVKMKLKWHF